MTTGAKKLWSGRFSETASESLEDFWNSIRFDQRLAAEDIRGSIAHARMLGATGILAREEAESIIAGLEAIAKDHAAGKIAFSPRDEDVHMNIERLLHERIGAVAGKLHTARSRNDQVATDMHLFVREASAATIGFLHGLQSAFIKLAAEQGDAIMPGYTHLQRAQPVLFGQHFLAYVWMFQRDIGRMRDCAKRANISPLGAGALAGTTFPIDRDMTAKELGFDGIYPNSMDAVSDRDFVVEHLAANALIAAHLSRLCEEVILWMSSEFGFITLSDAYCTGSSMMPQKKNADLAELVRGKTGRVYGALMGMLTVLKGTPLAYNKDFQEDKEALFDSVDTVQKSLHHLAGMMAGLKANRDAMRKAAERGFLNATDVADYLAARGVPFREAHEVVGKLVRHCLDAGKELAELPLPELQTFSPVFAEDIYAAMDLQNVVSRRMSAGGTAPAQLAAQMKLAQSALHETKEWLDQHAHR